MSEQVVCKNKVVAFTYSITDTDGEILEQSRLPMEYLHGSGDSQMFPEVEQALEGKKNGESVSVTLPPEQAFGPHDPSMTFTDDVENVPTEYRYVGARPKFSNDKGETMELTVTRVEDGKITFDANHPYAGKTVTFNVTINGLRDANEAELDSGLTAADPDTLH